MNTTNLEVEEPDWVGRIASLTANSLNRAQAAFVYDYFGSIERFQEMAHLYVFEEEPVQMDIFEDDLDFRVGNQVSVQFHQKFRMRPKTLEELEYDRTHQIERPTRESIEAVWPPYDH